MLSSIAREEMSPARDLIEGVSKKILPYLNLKMTGHSQQPDCSLEKESELSHIQMTDTQKLTSL